MSQDEGSIWERQKINQTFLDKATLVASGSALGFSLAFLKNLHFITSKCLVWLLVASWLCFCFSLVCNICNLYMSASAGSKENIDSDEKRRINKKTRCLNFSSVFLFIAGLLFLTLFATSSLIFATYQFGERKIEIVDIAARETVIGIEGEKTNKKNQGNGFSQLEIEKFPKKLLNRSPSDYKKGAVEPFPSERRVPGTEKSSKKSFNRIPSSSRKELLPIPPMKMAVEPFPRDDN